MKKRKHFKEHTLWITLFGDAILPHYIPFYYRIYLLLCKLFESTKKKFVSCFKKESVVLEEQFEAVSQRMNDDNDDQPFINKTFSPAAEKDLLRPEIKPFVENIENLQHTLKNDHLRYTTKQGSFKAKHFNPQKERRKLWENTWLFAHSNVKSSAIVLDIGGASSIFSFFLAHLGCEVYVIDNDSGYYGVIYNARYVAQKMKWKMHVLKRDAARRLPFPDSFFDKIFCICVLEHLSSSARKKVMGEINRVLKPGGIVGLTFDYDEKRNTSGLDKGLRYSHGKKLIEDVIGPSQLTIYGNTQFIDDCPSDFFLGSLFLTKPVSKE